MSHSSTSPAVVPTNRQPGPVGDGLNRALRLALAVLLAVMGGIVTTSTTNSPLVTPAVAATATGSSGGYTVTSSANPTSLPIGGGTTTLTYTVTNTSGGRLYYYGDRNSICVTDSSDLVTPRYERPYIAAGGSATFTCTTKVTTTTDVAQTFDFGYLDRYGRIIRSSATLNDRVSVAIPAGALPSCDVPWYSSFYDTSGADVGTINPTSGAPTTKFEFPTMYTRYLVSNSAGSVGAYYTSSFAVPMTGSSGFAVDPTNPQFGYFSARDGSYGDFSAELFRIDLVTGAVVSLGYSANGAFGSNRMAVDGNGTLWSLGLDGTLYSLSGVSARAGVDATSQTRTTATSLTTQVVNHGIPYYYSGATRVSFSSLTSGDLAFDGTGTMWVLASTGSGSTSTDLITIGPAQLSKSSGVTGTLVGHMGTPGQVSGDGSYFNGLAFDTNGVLYASSVDDTTVDGDAANGASSFYTINKGTGAPTLVSKGVTSSSGVGDLASCALPMPRLEIEKTANPTLAVPGGRITYTITIKNVGQIDATGVTFTDKLPTGSAYVTGSSKLNGVAVPDMNGSVRWSTAQPVNGSTTKFAGVIPAGDTATMTFAVTMNSGVTEVCNQGSVADVVYPDGVLTDDPSKAGSGDATCVQLEDPKIEVVKKINGVDANTAPGVAVKPGDPMNVTFEVRNTGNAALTNVTVTDDTIAATAIDCTLAGATTPKNVLPTLEVGATATCTATYPAPAVGTQHTNTATATGTAPSGAKVTDTDPANAVTPGIRVVKQIQDKNGVWQDANTAAASANVVEGDTMQIRYLVQNLGIAPLVEVALTDVVSSPSGAPQITNLSCPATTLAGNDGTTGGTDQMTCTATYPAPAVGTQHTNTGTVVGKTVAVPATGTDEAIPSVTVTDDDPANAVSQAAPTSGITVKKYLNGDDAQTAPGHAYVPGATMNITFLVQNTGNTPLTGVTVSDSDVTNITCPATTLAADDGVAGSGPDQMTCTATLVAPAAGVQHVNTATATGTPPPGLEPPTDTDVAYAHVPAIEVTKLIQDQAGTWQDANTAPGAVVAEGQPMQIRFVVKNLGVAPLTNVTLTDSDIPDATNITCPRTTLSAAGTADATMTCTATIAAPAPGTQHTDTATVVGTPPTNPDGSQPPKVTDDDPANAIVPGTPGISVVKRIDGADANTTPGVNVTVGQAVPVTFVVKNTGNVPLTNVALSDQTVEGAAVSGITCPATTLAAGASMTCTGSLTMTSAGALHHDTVTVTGLPPQDPTTPTTPPTPVTDTDEGWANTPAIQVIKKINGNDADTAPGVTVPEGSMMDVTFEVTNTGEVALSGVKVTDTDVAADAIACPKTTLAPGETMICTATLAAPAVGTQHTNIGTVVGTPPPGPDGTPREPVTDDNPANAVSSPKPVPGVDIEKLIEGSDADAAPGVTVAVGQPMAVTLIVRNTGNTVLSDVTVTDDKIAASAIQCPAGGTNVIASMNPGDEVTCVATIPAPAAGTQHENTAKVTGTPPDGLTPPTDEDKGYANTPGVQIVKYINGDDANTAPGVTVAAGDDMTVTFVVTNTGLAPLTNVTVTDDTIAATTIVCDGSTNNVVAQLAAGASVTCRATIAAPAPGTVHTNVGTVVATPPTNPADGTTPPKVTDDDPANANVPGTPGISVVKLIDGADANSTPGVNVTAGEAVPVTFVVKNTGNVALTGITLSDQTVEGAAVTGITCPATTLAAGASMTCSGSLTLTQAGELHHDIVTVTGVPPKNPDGSTPENPTDTDEGWANTPAIQVVKKINGNDADTAPGVVVPEKSTMQVTFEVTNTGDVALTNVKVNDTDVAADAITCPKTTLAVGETMVCTATLPAPAVGTQHTNIATVVGTPPPGPDGTPREPVTDDNPANAVSTPEPVPGIDITKLINGDDANAAPGVSVVAGQPMKVTFVVRNTGNTVLTDVTITDDKITATDITCPKTTLAAGEQMTCTASMSAPATGVQHENTAKVTGTPPDGLTPPTDEDKGFANTPGITIVKSINGDDANTAPGVTVLPGSTMEITYLVTNTGVAPLTGITVTDDKVPARSITCPADTLAAGASMTCTATLVAPEAGVQHTNVGTVSGQPPVNPDGSTPPKVTDDDPANAWPQEAPAIKVVKKINGDDANTAPGVAVDAGSSMQITFEVTNTGGLPLSDVVVTDDTVTDITCPATTLAVGATMTCTATLPAPAVGTQHTNTAKVTGTPDNPDGTPGTPVEDDDPANSHVPAIDLTKLVNGVDANDVPGVSVPAGSMMTITFVVKNPGVAPLTNVTVTDDTVPASAIRCGTGGNVIATLAAGATVTCTATLPAPKAGEQHTNVGTVTGTPPENPGGDKPIPPTDTDKGNANTPSVEIVKSINGNDANTAPGVQVATGSQMSITFDVRNTGLVPLTNVTVTDDKVASDKITCPSGSNVIGDLAVGQSVQCTATYPAPADGVLHTNTGTVTGETPEVPATPEEPAVPSVPVEDDDPANATGGAAALQIVKKINGDDVNTAPGVAVAAGSTMTITYDVTNTGKRDLVDVLVTDDVISGITCPKTDLAVGESMQCTAVAIAPAAGTQHTNTGTVTGKDPENPGTPVTDEDKGNAYVPAVKIVKLVNGDDANTAPGVAVTAGSTMQITFRVTNTGLAPLTNVTVTDDKVAADAITCGTTGNVVPVLAAGASVECTATLAAPAVGEQHTNTGTVVGTPPTNPDGSTPPTVTDDDPGNAYVPAIQIVKKLNGEDADTLPGVVVAEGSTVEVTFEVTNTGLAPLTNVRVTDDTIAAAGITCTGSTNNVIASLAPGQTVECSASFVAPKATEDGGKHTNIGTATGTPPKNPDGSTPEEPTDDNPGNSTSTGTPKISIIKKINGNDAETAPGVPVAVGSTMAITYTVTNTGTVPLTDVTVSDDKIDATGIICPKKLLAVGEVMECTASMTAPAVGEQHTNVGTVVGTPPNNPDGTPGTPVTDDDKGNAWTPELTIVKRINGADAETTPVAVEAGSMMEITFVVTNTGVAPMVDVTVTDDVLPATAITCESGTNVIGSLAAGTSATCTATLKAPKAGDLHTNVGTVTGETPKIPEVPATPDKPGTPEVPGVPVTDTDKGNASTPSIKIIKKINGDDADTAPGVSVVEGSQLAITFDVTNDGVLDLVDVTVTDDKIPADAITCPDGTNVIGALAVNHTVQCTATITAPRAGELHTNIGVATGHTPDVPANPDNGDPEIPGVPVEDDNPGNSTSTDKPVSSVQILKLVNGDDAETAPGVAVEAGSMMDITFRVTNTGTTTLTDVTVTDDTVDAAAITCKGAVKGKANVVASLAPGKSFECIASIPAPKAGVQHTNVGKVTAETPKNPDGTPGKPVDDTDKGNAWTPAITIVKKINGDDANTAPGVAVKAGATMAITFEVRNTGLAELTDVTVTDDKVAAESITCPDGGNVIASLAAGQSVQCTAELKAPEVGVQHTNTAMAEGAPPVNPDGSTPPKVHDDDPAHAWVPSLKVVKKINGQHSSADHPVVLAPGQRMDFTFEITNTSTGTLRQVRIVDDVIPASQLNCPKKQLAPGESMTCTAWMNAPEVGQRHDNIVTVHSEYEPLMPNTPDRQDDGHAIVKKRPDIARTGAGVEPWQLALGGLLVVGGAGLVLRGRRKQA